MTKRTLTTLLGGASMAALMSLATAARAEDITLHALMEDVPETHIIEAMLPEFTKATGIKVEFQKLVYSDMHDKLVAQLTGNASEYNVLEVDFLWAGEFPAAGWLIDLKPLVEKDKVELSSFVMLNARRSVAVSPAHNPEGSCLILLRKSVTMRLRFIPRTRRSNPTWRRP